MNKQKCSDVELSIVIPCYRSEMFLDKTIYEIEMELGDISHEIILVDDSSPDGTYGVIQELCGKYKNITGMRLSKNFGQHSALMAGFHYVNGKIIICMDDDGQTPASEIKKLLDGLNSDVDVVYASYKMKKHSWYRNIGSSINAKMTEWMLGKPKELYISSFFVARRFIIDEILKYKHSYPYVIGLVLRSTNRIVNVDVLHNEREIGVSGYSLKKLIGLWMNGFTAFSVKPLRAADVVGTILAVVGLLTALFLILKRIIIGYSVVEGWYSLISVILFVGGLLMLVLGMTGEYIGRTYMCINDAPQYVIRENCCSKEVESE